MKILLVDDHGLFREGTALLLKSVNPDIVVDYARNARECMTAASAGEPDLVLLDLGLPDRQGLDVLQDLKAIHPDLPVVVLSGHEDPETVMESIKRGAMGFIPKSSEDPQILFDALRKAANGEVTIPTSVARPQNALQQDRGTSPKKLGLTSRQVDVLRLLLLGLPNKSIARKLDIAETTARDYVSELLAAFCVTNRTQLVIEVARRGVNVTPDKN